MKKVFPLILILSTILPASGKISLEQAVNMALERNHEVKAGFYQVKQLKLEKKEAFTRYLPRINATASFTHLNDPIDLDLDPLRDLLIQLETSGTLADMELQTLLTRGTGLTDAEKSAYTTAIQSGLNSAIPSLNMHVLDQDIFRVTLDFLQPIWMGGRLRALNRSAELKKRSGDQDLLLTREKVMEETIRLYFLNQFLSQVLEVRGEVEEGISGHLKRAESLYQAGLIARYQLTRAQVAFSDAREKRLHSAADLETARSVLRNLLHLDETETVELSTPLPYLPMNRTPRQWKTAIVTNNGTLKKIRLGRQLARQKRKADMGEYLPQLFAFGQYEVVKDDLSLLDPDWRIGVGLKLNLFSGGEKVLRNRKNRMLIKQVTETEQNVTDLLGKLGDKLYYSALNEKTTLDHAPIRMEEADENLRLANSRFSSGLGISLEVVDAHMIREKVRTESLQARFKYLSYQLKLHELSLDLSQFMKTLEK